ncbi:MAG TPA: DUF4124 domain-containing protein, partial [Chromatiales bacterium]|nr:DUF4124 domain-containing protein [Chromatiales bacterium]
MSHCPGDGAKPPVQSRRKIRVKIPGKPDSGKSERIPDRDPRPAHVQGERQMGVHTLFTHAWSISLLLAGLLLAAPASAAIYRWTDSSGVIHYSQTPPTSPERNVVRLPESG